jgi:sporulation protein YlmC with PRC-barrel domain
VGSDLKNDFAIGCLLAATMATSAFAATTVLTAAPSEGWTVANYYKQAVYDPKESRIGDIDDVLADKSGKIKGLVIGVGGFLGAGEKDVIVPFTAVKTAKKNDRWWLTLDETKDDLKGAPGFKYDEVIKPSRRASIPISALALRSRRRFPIRSARPSTAPTRHRSMGNPMSVARIFASHRNQCCGETWDGQFKA